MSTGDQSEFMRGRLATRGKAALEQAPKFMQDGFDRWASKTEVGSGGRLMDLPQKENSGGRRKRGSFMKELLIDGGAANPDSSQAIAKYSKELADKGLRLAIKKNKKILAGQDAEADEEAFNQALQEWQDYYFGLPKELQKFASQGSEDLAAESEELQNRVDRFLFDQRQKKSREERDLAGNGIVDSLKGLEVSIDPEIVQKSVSAVKGVLGSIPGIKEGLDAVEKVGQFGTKVKNIATDVRKSLQSPQVIEKVRSRTSPPSFGEETLKAVTNFMELVGLGRFKSSEKAVKRVMKSKPFKQYNSGEFGETIDAFRKYAQTRGNPSSAAELKAMLKKQVKDAKGLMGSARAGVKKLTAPPADVVAATTKAGTAKKTWAEYFKEWSEFVGKVYKEFEKGAPTLVMAMESTPMDNLLKRTERPQVGREIAEVARIIFPEATKSIPKPKELGAGRYMNGKGLDKSLGLEYYLNRIKTLEDSGNMTKAAADAKRKEYRDFFSKSGSGSCCRGCDGGGMCEGKGILEDMRGSMDSKMKGLEAEARGKLGKGGRRVRKGKGALEDSINWLSNQIMPKKVEAFGSPLGRLDGGRKPSAYAQFVKQYAAKHPGPDLMKRAAAAWKSQK